MNLFKIFGMVAINNSKAKKQLDETSDKASKTSKEMQINFDKVGKTFVSVGNKIEKFGKKLTVVSMAATAGLTVSMKSAIDFEDAFTGVEKTVDGTTEQLSKLKQGIRDMSKTIPASTTEIAGVAEAAGQLGIKTDDILNFTKVMIDLGNATNLSADEAASSLAKFANIMNTSADDYSRLGATIVDLGNNFATTEADITSMAMRIAGAGKTVGLSEANVLSLATALSSVGIEAEMGGSAISKAMIQMSTAVETNSEQLKDFAKIAGMSTKEFKESFENDAIGTITKFIVGLGDTESAGESTLAMLSDLGFEEVRLRDTMLRAANASDVFSEAINLGNNAWEENTALTNEANKRYGTFKSQIQIAINKLKDLAITFGNKLTPIIPKVTKKVEQFTKWVENLNDGQTEAILKVVGWVAVLKPLSKILGGVTTAIGTTIKGVDVFTKAINVANGKITSTSNTVNLFAKVIKNVSSPIGVASLAITGITALIGAFAISINNSATSAKKNFEEIEKSAEKFSDGIQNATSYLDNFNSILFVSSEEQENLSEQMSEIQSRITTICQTASKERRNYTQEEITQLDEYFTKLRELNQRELEIQSNIADAIKQQAKTNSIMFNGSLEEYEETSQKWIKTAEEQRDKTLEIIEKQATEEIVLLNQKFGDQADIQNDSYAKEYLEILNQKQKKIEAANSEVTEIAQAYATGYEKILMNSDEFKSKKAQRDKELENEEKRYSEEIKRIEEDLYSDNYQKQQKKELADEIHQAKIESINRKMVNSLKQAKTDEVGVLASLINEAEKYSTNSETTAKETVDKIVNQYSKLPPQTRSIMQNAMSPMEEEMELAKPRLFNKADNISLGIANRLRAGFDEHSPSKLTRKIMRYAMQPMEEEMDKSKATLFQKSSEMVTGITEKLSKFGTKVSNLSIDLLKKDMNYAHILDKTNNFGMNENEQFMGAGEVGSETVAGTNSLMNMIQQAVTSQNLELNARMDTLIEILLKYLPLLLKRELCLDSGAIVGELTPLIDKELGSLADKKGRGR